MKRKFYRRKFGFGMLILLLLIVIFISAYSILNIGQQEESYSVSVILDNSSSDRWIVALEGMEQAAGDYGVELNVISTSKISSLAGEKELINRELEDDAEGIILQMVEDTGASDLLENISNRTKVLLVDTDVTPEGVYEVVKPDYKEVGEAIGERILKDYGDRLANKKIGILSGDQNQLAFQQRLEGLEAALGDYQTQISWIMENENTDSELRLAQIQKKGSVDVLVALSTEETELAVDCVTEEEGYAYTRIYGEGSSEKTIYYLDQGLISALVVPNEFNMGYLSVKKMVEELEYKTGKEEDFQVGYLIIDKENLYDKDNQKILFPIVQ